MTWKEKRLITLLSIILAVLAAAVLIVLSIRYRSAQAAKEQGQTASQQELAQTAQSDYVALSYNNGSATLSFALNEDSAWYWESQPDFPLNDETIRSILSVLKDLTPQQTLDRPEDLSDCGLDVPVASLSATAPDGGVLTIDLGNTTTDGNSYYADINHNADHIYIIADTLYQAMQTPIYEMCRLPEMPELTADTITSIMLQGPVTGTEEVEEGQQVDIRCTTTITAARSDDGAVTWRSGGSNVTDSPDVQALLEDLSSLQMAQCVDYRPSDEAATFCGFDDPVTLTVNYRSASGAEEVFTMNIGTQNMDGTGRYVRLNEDTPIYLVELSLLDPLMRLAVVGMENS